jgi:hypothetical protein
MNEGLFCIIAAVAVPCAILGYVIGSAKNSGAEGLALGLLFGPLGVIAAFALDNRPQCRSCLGRIDPAARVCPHCTAAIVVNDPARQQEAIRAAQRRARELESMRIRRAVEADLRRESFQAKLRSARETARHWSRAPFVGFHRACLTAAGGDPFVGVLFEVLAYVAAGGVVVWIFSHS